MPLIISATDFTLDVNIRLANAGNDATTLNAWVAEYELPFYESVLGPALYAIIFPDGANSDIQGQPAELIAFLKYCALRFVYDKYKRGTAYTDTVNGATTLKQENAVTTLPDFNMVKNWNQMVSKLRDLYAYLAANPVLYPSFVIGTVISYRYINRPGL